MLLYGPLMKRASQRVVFLAINIKTKAILGRIISTKTVEDSHIIELYSLIIKLIHLLLKKTTTNLLKFIQT